MSDSYLTVYEDNEIMIKEKGSKFIAHLVHVESEEEVSEYLQKLKKDYYDASHHCTAYVLSNQNFHYHDDGEPTNTAGKPIYDMIQGANIVNVFIVVIRYFGGTKLGTGGLIRAYGQAAKEVIESAKIETVILRDRLEFEYPYDLTNTVMHVMKHYDIQNVEHVYDEKARVIFDIRQSEAAAFCDQITNSSHGQIQVDVNK